MKMKTSELEGAALDWAVAKAGGHQPETRAHVNTTLAYISSEAVAPYMPSTNWSQGGPIADELLLSGQWQAWQILEGVTFMNHTDEGLPLKGVGWGNEKEFTAETTLIAACRAKVFTKLGDEVDIPEELL